MCLHEEKNSYFCWTIYKVHRHFFV
jgi:hypothetical protein